AAEALHRQQIVRLFACLEEKVKHGAVTPPHPRDSLAGRCMADNFGWNSATGQKLAEAVGDHEAQEVALFLLHRDGQIEQKDRLGLTLLLRLFDQLDFQRLAEGIDDCLSEV